MRINSNIYLNVVITDKGTFSGFCRLSRKTGKAIAAQNHIQRKNKYAVLSNCVHRTRLNLVGFDSAQCCP